MLLVRPMIQPIVGEGSFKEGPWRYRILSILMVTPMSVPFAGRSWPLIAAGLRAAHTARAHALCSYSLILMLVGTAAGRHHYFKQVVLRMWGRFLPARFFAKKA